MTNTTYRLDDVIQRIQRQIRDEDMPQKVYRSMNGFSQLAKAILTTRGNEWTTHVIDENGNPLLTPSEQEQFARVFRQHTQNILDALRPSPSQTGGADEEDQKVASLMNVTPTELDAMREQAITGRTNAYDPEKATGVDELYMSMMKKINTANTSVNHFASQYGVLRLEKESDLDTDVRLIPKAIASVLSSGVGLISPPLKIPTQAFLEKIKVPFRLIVTAIYLFLDMMRMGMTLQGQDSQRRTLTLLIALLEFLRGDWKKAALTFMGYYGASSMWIGQMGKIYLTLFQTLSPTLQDQISYGALDVGKSFLIGILLAVFKIAAPEEIRLPLIGILQKIAAKKATIDGILTESGLPPREDYFAPSFQDLNNIQSLMDDPDFVCSCEYEELMKNADKSAILHVIFQLMRLPVTREYREKYQCGTRPCKTFVESLVETGRKKQERMGELLVTEPPVTENTKTENTETPVTDSKPTDVQTETPVDESKQTETVIPGESQTENTETSPLPPTIEPVKETMTAPLPPTIEPVKETAPTVVGGRRPRRIIYGLPHA